MTADPNHYNFNTESYYNVKVLGNCRELLSMVLDIMTSQAPLSPGPL